MAEIRNLAVSGVLFVAFAVGLLFFVFQFQDMNNAGTKIVDDPAFYSLNKTVNGMANDLSNTKNDIADAWNQSSTISFGWVIFTGVVKFGMSLYTIPINLSIMIIELPGALITGGSNPIISVITTLILLAVIISTIILVIKFWRQGS
jgi:hypothetical protein